MPILMHRDLSSLHRCLLIDISGLPREGASWSSPFRPDVLLEHFTTTLGHFRRLARSPIFLVIKYSRREDALWRASGYLRNNAGHADFEISLELSIDMQRIIAHRWLAAIFLCRPSHSHALSNQIPLSELVRPSCSRDRRCELIFMEQIMQ